MRLSHGTDSKPQMTRRLFLRSIILALALGLAVGPAPWPARAEGSSAFERFRRSFFEEDSARDGLDIEALLRLEAEERKRAEDMLIRQLPDARGGHRPWRAAITA